MGARLTAPPAAPPRAESNTPAPRAGLTLFELARLDEARREAAAVQATLVPEAARAGDAPRARGRRLVLRALQLGALAAVAVGAVIAYKPSFDATTEAMAPRGVLPASPPPLPAARGTPVDAADPSAVPVTIPVRPSFGVSESVYLRVAMPGQVIEYPVAPKPGAAGVTYEWVRATDGSAATRPLPLTGSVVVAPAQPGTYHLALASGAARRRMDDVTLAVLTPFAQKLGGTLNGYLIGRYPFELLGGERPLGFVEVMPGTARLPVSRHLRLEDFLTHDGQAQWPRYVAVSPLLLDKIELVVAEIARVRGVQDPGRILVDVHSGFRTPLHNGGVEGSAFNSRHQYGDAADVAVDADGDGRFTALDAQWVGLAAEMVEKRHPELVGGLGLYTSVASPYVHIDVRGRRARWWRR